MSKKLKVQLVKRLKSFLWRAAGMGVVVIISFLLDNSAALEIPLYLQGVLGLFLGEVTKYINKSAK